MSKMHDQVRKSLGNIENRIMDEAGKNFRRLITSIETRGEVADQCLDLKGLMEIGAPPLLITTGPVDPNSGDDNFDFITKKDGSLAGIHLVITSRVNPLYQYGSDPFEAFMELANIADECIDEHTFMPVMALVLAPSTSWQFTEEDSLLAKEMGEAFYEGDELEKAKERAQELDIITLSGRTSKGKQMSYMCLAEEVDGEWVRASEEHHQSLNLPKKHSLASTGSVATINDPNDEESSGVAMEGIIDDYLERFFHFCSLKVTLKQKGSNDSLKDFYSELFEDRKKK